MRSEQVCKAGLRFEYLFTLGDRLALHPLVNCLDTLDLCLVEIELRHELEEMLRAWKVVQLGRSREAHAFAVAQLANFICSQARDLAALTVGIGRYLVIMLCQRGRRCDGEQTDAAKDAEHRFVWFH